eukprot:NODE_232_length_12051_cov_1.040997.p2 type:complete len:584 gc:universal NODE_232_length_12051_cov_1.040997:1760-3511(+)
MALQFNHELPLQRCTIAFCGKGRPEWSLLAIILGAKVTNSISIFNSHLVMLDYERSKKKQLAKKLKIQVCGTQWLVDCLARKRCQPINIKLHEDDIYKISTLKDFSFYLHRKVLNLEEIILYAGGVIKNDLSVSYEISENPSESIYNEKWIKLCIIHQKILNLPIEAFEIDDGQFEEPERKFVPKKSDFVDIQIEEDENYDIGRDLNDIIVSQSQPALDLPVVSTFEETTISQDCTPIPNTLMKPSGTGIFDSFAFVFCGFEANSRRIYRAHLLKKGGHCFAISDLKWTNQRDNQETSLRTLLRYLRDLKFKWVLVWSSKLPYSLTTKKFVMKSTSTTTVQVVNETWLTDSLSQNICMDLDSFSYKPFKYGLPLPEFKDKIVTVTGYDTKYRLTLKSLIKILGATYVDSFTDQVHFLIAPKPYNENNAKMAAATKYKIQIVTKEWLNQCANTGKFVETKPYLIEPPIVKQQAELKITNLPLDKITLYISPALEKFRTIASNLGAKFAAPEKSDYVLLERDSEFAGEHSKSVFLDPQWVIACQKARTAVNVDPFRWEYKEIKIDSVIPKKRQFVEPILNDIDYK